MFEKNVELNKYTSFLFPKVLSQRARILFQKAITEEENSTSFSDFSVKSHKLLRKMEGI